MVSLAVAHAEANLAMAMFVGRRAFWVEERNLREVQLLTSKNGEKLPDAKIAFCSIQQKDLRFQVHETASIVKWIVNQYPNHKPFTS